MPLYTANPHPLGTWSQLKAIFINPTPERRSGGGSVSVGGSYGTTDARLSEIFGLSGAVTVTEHSVTALPVVHRCIDVLSSTYAGLPCDLHKIEGTISTPAIGHPCRFMVSRPHDLFTDFMWRKTMFANVLTWGNAYARITRNGVYRPIKAKPYHPSQVSVTTDTYGDTLYYQFPDVPGRVPASDVIHFKIHPTPDGLMGRSVIRHACEFLKGPLQTQRVITKLYENGINPGAVILSDKKIDGTGKNNIKEGWRLGFGGTENVGKVAVLDEGMKYQQISLNPVDAQLVEFMELSAEQVCMLFGVQQHVAGILTNSTNNNIEQQSLEYLSFTLGPHVKNFQQELNYKTLAGYEQGKYSYTYDTDSLQLSDIASKKDLYQMLISTGAISINEARDKFGFNPTDGGDIRYTQGANMPIDSVTGLPIYPPQKNATPAPINGQKLTVN